MSEQSLKDEIDRLTAANENLKRERDELLGIAETYCHCVDSQAEESASAWREYERVSKIIASIKESK